MVPTLPYQSGPGSPSYLCVRGLAPSSARPPPPTPFLLLFPLYFPFPPLNPVLSASPTTFSLPRSVLPLSLSLVSAEILPSPPPSPPLPLFPSSPLPSFPVRVFLIQPPWQSPILTHLIRSGPPAHPTYQGVQQRCGLCVRAVHVRTLHRQG